MDNVSKALIMAGGVFIAIMIVGVSMYLLSSARGIAKVSNDKVEASAIESFNRYYTTFKNPITGIDVVNIVNKVKNDQYNGHDIRISTEIQSTINDLEKATSDESDERNNTLLKSEIYTFEISGYDSDGYINEIKINK